MHAIGLFCDSHILSNHFGKKMLALETEDFKKQTLKKSLENVFYFMQCVYITLVLVCYLLPVLNESFDYVNCTYFFHNIDFFLSSSVCQTIFIQ